MVNPEFGYKQFAATDEEMLAVIYRYDPAYLVIEEGSPYGNLPGEVQLRRVVAAHPERFALERAFEVESTNPDGQAARLLVYRNLHRNPQAGRRLTIELLVLRRSLETQSRKHAAAHPLHQNRHRRHRDTEIKTKRKRG